MKKLDIKHSQFWMGDHADELSEKMDVFQLSSYRRAIANFVFILTGQNIPVRFADNKQSFTNQKVVFIGGDLSHGEFDATVGLACHEATHILFPKYFELVKLIWSNLPNDIYLLGKNKLSKNSIAQFTKETYNWIEDRFIDDYAFHAAPGYQGYYLALYDKYFLLSKVSRLLKSKAFRRNDLLSYRFRIINLINPNSDVDALPGLREVYDLLDLHDIRRLQRPEDRLLLAYDVVRIVIKNLIEVEEETTPKPTEKSDGSGGTDGESEETEQSDQSNEQPAESTEDTQERLDGRSIPENINEVDDVSEKQMEEGLHEFERQCEFLDGATWRSTLDAETLDRLNKLEDAGVELVHVGGAGGIPKVDCIVVRKLTWSLITSPDFPFAQHFGSTWTTQRTRPTGPGSNILPYENAEDGVRQGIALGQALGRKLQVRGESRTTHHTRLKDGRIDNRLLAEAGFGNVEIFYQNTVSQYKKAHLHLTVDASGSMSSKWQRTMTLVVTLAKAVSMVPNLSITVSFRAGISSDDSSPARVYHVIAYDSRTDKFSNVVQLFPYLCPNGYTPEGLAFEVIVKDIPASDDTLDCYFLNISDGEPFFPIKSSQYSGEVAQNHTRAQVERIRQKKVEVLSYFVEGDLLLDSQRVVKNMIAFRSMYGRDAKLIDVESVIQIAKTMNERFMRKVDDNS